MIIVRFHIQNDLLAIKQILAENDLFYPNQNLTDFWVAEQNNKVLGILQLENGPNYLFLSSLGVLQQYQNLGIASKMLHELTGNATQDVYLYTIIPRFFEKHGFKIIPAPTFIPSRSRFDCNNCERDKCVCMVKKAKRSE